VNLYLVSQTVNDGYDTYDSAVVAAESEADARLIHPGDRCQADVVNDRWIEHYSDGTLRVLPEFLQDWASRPSRVSVQLIGVAVEGTEAGVICASFIAG